ncbi:MAG: Outer-rane lipoprotein LolB [Pseudomonadota bacterium]|jgi:outer membrane lipoprotein LolB
MNRVTHTRRRHAGGALLPAALLLLALASGCASVAPPTATASSEQLQARWSGRLSLQIESDPPQAFHAGFELRGSAQAGELSLYSPLGTTLASARWHPEGAVLQRPDSSQAYPDLATLTTDLTGTALPVAALFDWLQGDPTEAEGWSVDLAGAADGRLRAQRHHPLPGASLRLILDQ